MTLTPDDFNNRILLGSITDRFYFNGTEIFKLNNSRFYKRLDHHLLGLPNWNAEVGLYLINAELFLLFFDDGHYTHVIGVHVIESETVEPFTGFETGKVYSLTNNQVWRQTDSLYAPNHYSGGFVRILEGRIKVDNWDFYPQVEQIE